MVKLIWGLIKGLWTLNKGLLYLATHPPAPPTREEILEFGRQQFVPINYPPPWVFRQGQPHHHHHGCR